MIVVNADAKKLIEKLDPDLHQFFPVDLYRSRHRIIEGEFFILAVTNFQQSTISDQLLAESSAPKKGKPTIGRVSPYNPSIDCAKLGKQNLWREKTALGGLFVSDRFFEEFQKNNLSFFKAHKIRKMINILD